LEESQRKTIITDSVCDKNVPAEICDLPAKEALTIVEAREMITVTKSDLPPLEKYVDYLRKIWASRWLTNDGELAQLLEKRLEEFLHVKNLALVSNGTQALQIALKAFDIKGEVITTPFTFAATTNVLLWARLTPVFADINPKTYNIDPSDVEKKITDKTSAILAVHVYGNPCYVDELQEIANKHNLRLIYDAAHAFGVEYENQSVLNYGDISVLSFHATKVFNTIEGGAIAIKDEESLEKVKLLRNHGIRSEEEVVVPGTNAKMNEFQAAMGLCNLESIDNNIRVRKNLYEHYKEKLVDARSIKFQKIIASKYNYSYMPVLFESKEKRDELHSVLLKNRIKARKYFYPLTADFDYFKEIGVNLVKKYQLINSYDVASRILCLPLYSTLNISVVDKITSLICKSYKKLISDR
jgi:dTDP-4-amino-4,6-dideoxygalactose transaminase